MATDKCNHKSTRYRGLQATIVCLVTLCAALPAASREVTIEIDNNRIAGAQLYIAVFSAEEGHESWQQEPHQALKTELPSDPSTHVQLELPDGQYAVRAYADTNSNGQLDTAAFNRPEEPFAMSMREGRDSVSPHFENAVVTVDDSNQSIALTLVYPEGSKPDAAQQASGKQADSDGLE